MAAKGRVPLIIGVLPGRWTSVAFQFKRNRMYSMTPESKRVVTSALLGKEEAGGNPTGNPA